MSEPDSAANALEKKVVRTSPLLWVLGVILFLFLSTLGTQALYDIADIFHEPGLDEFQETTVKPLEKKRELLSQAPNPRKVLLDRAQADLDNQERVLRSAEASWSTWLSTRATLGGTGNEDQQVRRRRGRLDTLRRERDQAEKALSELRAAPDPRDARLAAVDKQIKAAQEQAERDYKAAHLTWTWEVLAARLALIIPLWGLAVFLWSRRLNSKYITLMWGYWAFTTWMLLYGIWPYLPHYGYYVPMTLGAATTVWVAVTLVRYFNSQAPARRLRIVDRAIARHQCPGCERDYLTGGETRFIQGLVRRATLRHYEGPDLRPRACPACSLKLFDACNTCGHQQIAHLDFCSACGNPWRAAPAPTAP